MARGDFAKAGAGDMVRSLAVILVPVLVICLLFTINLRDAPVQRVDVGPVLSTARKEAPYPVLAPAGLPDTWVPTRVEWTRQGDPGINGQPSAANRWMNGWLDPDQMYVQIEQRDGSPDLIVREALPESLVEGDSTVTAGDGAQTWQRRLAENGRTRALVLTGKDVTAIVSGDVAYAELEVFASTLRS